MTKNNGNPSPQTDVEVTDLLKDAYLEGWHDACGADQHERDREHAEVGWDFSDAKRSRPATNVKTLEEVKYLALTAGAPDYIPMPDAFRRILWLCRQAGVTKTLEELGDYAQGRSPPPSTREEGLS